MQSSVWLSAERNLYYKSKDFYVQHYLLRRIYDWPVTSLSISHSFSQPLPIGLVSPASSCSFRERLVATDEYKNWWILPKPAVFSHTHPINGHWMFIRFFVSITKTIDDAYYFICERKKSFANNQLNSKRVSICSHIITTTIHIIIAFVCYCVSSYPNEIHTFIYFFAEQPEKIIIIIIVNILFGHLWLTRHKCRWVFGSFDVVWLEKLESNERSKSSPCDSFIILFFYYFLPFVYMCCLCVLHYPLRITSLFGTQR